ncbi:MAG: hypothetical protein ACI9JL_004256 [Paracoccaceae bacterium]|jgi:hypothetical protein
MTDLPSEDVTICDGEITIDAALLAPKLGLSPETLKAEMARGLVYSVAETGVDEDVGRTRLTFRYRSRAWTMVVDTDGNLVESIAPAPKASPANTGRLSLSDFVRSSS